MAKKNQAAAQLGKRGGKARARKLSPVERTESARKAAQARWKKAKERSKNPKPFYRTVSK